MHQDGEHVIARIVVPNLDPIIKDVNTSKLRQAIAADADADHKLPDQNSLNSIYLWRFGRAIKLILIVICNDVPYVCFMAT